MKDTQAIQHGLEGSQEKKYENEIARIDGAQLVPTVTSSVLLRTRGTETIGFISYVYTPDAKLETWAKTEHGRPNQNTNARKLSERKGLGGPVQSDRKTSELATKSTAQAGQFKTLDSKGRKASMDATCSSL